VVIGVMPAGFRVANTQYRPLLPDASGPGTNQRRLVRGVSSATAAFVLAYLWKRRRQKWLFWPIRWAASTQSMRDGASRCSACAIILSGIIARSCSCCWPWLRLYC